jgi:ATP-dependent DNA helicase RecG
MSSIKIINELLKLEKNDRFDYQESLSLTGLGEVICSFLNCNGGQYLIGISNKKEIIGIEDAENRKTEIESFLVNEIIPEAPIMVSVEDYNKKQLILVKVWSGTKQPFVFNGTIFYRNYDKTIQATSKQIAELIHNRKETEIHWERQPSLGIELDDLDLEEIRETMSEAYNQNKMREEKNDPIDFLSYYGLYENGYFTNAAVILFAKNPTKFIPQTRVRVSYLLHGKTGDSFKDDKILEGNLFKNMNAIMSFFDKHLMVTRKFNEKDWKRKDEYTYPIPALREGVMNALIHRDYSKVSSALSIIIYSNKVEISNTGKLPFEKAELKKNHLSMPYNPDIAHMVFLRGYIEKIGRGTLKIIEACKKAGLKPPVWETGEQVVRLIFFSKVKLDSATDRVIDSATDRVIDRVIDRATKDVKNRTASVLKAIVSTEGGNNKDYVNMTDIPIGSIGRFIKDLKKAELIEFKGAPRTGGYYLTERMKSLLPDKM